MRRLLKIAVLFFSFSQTCNWALAQAPSLLVNGIATVADEQNHTLYAAIAPTEQERAAYSLESADGRTYVLNGSTRIGHLEKNLAWKILHKLQAEGDTTIWKLVFTTLPVIDLRVPEIEKVSKDISRQAEMRIMAPGRIVEGKATATLRASVHYRGSTAAKFPKKSFSVKFIDDTGNEKEVSIFGINTTDKWILDAMGIDFSRLRNRVCFDIWNSFNRLPSDYTKARRNGTMGEHVELVLNGVYHGLYCLSDKISRSLLGLKKATTQADGTPLIRGVLYKCGGADFSTRFLLMPSEEEINERGDFNKPNWFDWELSYPEDYPSRKAWSPLTDAMEYAARAAQDSAYATDEFSQYFDLDNAVDFCLFIHVMMLYDNMMHNVYLSANDIIKNSRLAFTPWDLDGGMGRDGWAKRVEWYSFPENSFQQTQPFRTLFDNKNSFFFKAMAHRWADLRLRQLSVDSVKQRINAYAHKLEHSGAWERERRRWNDSIISPLGFSVNLTTDIHEETDYMIEWYRKNFIHIERTFSSVVPMTGISAPVPSGSFRNEMDGAYDLTGRFVTKPKRGIYIKNGRKYIKN